MRISTEDQKILTQKNFLLLLGKGGCGVFKRWSVWTLLPVTGRHFISALRIVVKTHLKIRHETGQGGRKRFPLKNQVYRRADNTFSAALWACHYRPPPMPVRGCICPFVGTQSHRTPVSRSLLMPLNAALADFDLTGVTSSVGRQNS